MLKKFGSRGMDHDPFGGEDTNPMAGVSNLADAMLVLAVGIMLALIINWNIDVSQTSTITQIDEDNMTEITDDFDSVTEDELIQELGEQGLEEAGKVYVDPDTGKQYLVVPDED